MHKRKLIGIFIKIIVSIVYKYIRWFNNCKSFIF